MPPPTTLPTIDISPFLHSSSTPAARAATAAALAHACAASGFFYLTGHGIADSTLAHVVELARRFFLESSDDEKARIARRGVSEGGDGARGYQRVGENVTLGRRDWHEAVDLYREFCEGEEEGFGGKEDGLLRGRNLWPRHPPELRDLLEAYVERVKGVGTAVVRAMGCALGEGLEEVFVRETGKSFWVLRMVGYPGLPEEGAEDDDGDGEEEGERDMGRGVSCGEHTDYGCITLLLADATPNALQVRTRDGAWISADPVPGAFVVNIGDMMERWTNGLWKSTPHRVVHRGSGYRVSVPFFFEPDFGARVRPLERCVQLTGGVERYSEVAYGEFLMRKIRGNFV
ncbi:uncharacterized protein K452DRAFT_259722 [Aplosporella prunicola CBS 121167]|uniref:Fe2OG dioxygenase domain-containing protein n=1 Tax=Aplosporella prunicola CBS 121167 TaxID=1176127 RepID=A0A6A6AZW6_9PEZI|nr:uncharacterized protein K452DRAFT_259722 [Aplosporella prunicola CBS 121167]KAF2136011.1 hypothetical protein K452DRAFT_259722 [Aplosporella prunicola CBS 121167]